MKEYQCHKIVNAEPMTLGDYNIFKGWKIPIDENPLTEGYKVVYKSGYISWSPKNEFDEGYTETSLIVPPPDTAELKSELDKIESELIKG